MWVYLIESIEITSAGPTQQDIFWSRMHLAQDSSCEAATVLTFWKF